MSTKQAEEPMAVLQPHKRTKRSPPPRPMKLICVNGKIVGSAQVIVSPSDPNWWRGMAVRRNGQILVRGEP